ncbi:DNA double-strand break repair nuclease NurA [Lagierella sp.]|uniref:DNA double-strand break repair nuclease NurA n=1 Tax=Lagierella sp. TaxID=2849657 RepID=UPI00262A60AA|nr:DNA double-strand break repair nuclease NurA [Lagierella sp.]
MKSEMVEKIKILNEKLKNKYSLLDSLSVEDKKAILSKFGYFDKLNPLNTEELEKLEKSGGVFAVDGSTNKYGGAFPHYIQVFRGMAIKNNIDSIEKVEVYCPLLEDINIYEERNTLERILAKIEVIAALESLKEKPSIIIMDGSLIRYEILCRDYWTRLKEEALKKGILLIGIIEDIKTDIVFKNIKEDYDTDFFYDREFLFNSLEFRECFIPNKKDKGKDNYGFRSVFLRSSLQPNIIAVDILEEQFGSVDLALKLILSITHKKGRGIPFILDMVDLKARITNKKIKDLCETYIGKNRFELLFHSQRDKREM